MSDTFQIDFSASDRPLVVGIDLGTTNSLVAFMDLTGPRVIPGDDGNNLVPSVVSYSRAGEIVAGRLAREMLITEPERTVYSVKRLMGRGVADVQEELKLFPFRIAEGSESVIRLELGERKFTPPEISAFILRQLRQNAEADLGETVTKAVITVPAYFNDAQ
ncbi:MAG TPA: Hsp70 family protein, partial [Bryobacteraceae bacterium]|nr:Hsp70 family protein [Bryobacteraceae bacterium]